MKINSLYLADLHFGITHTSHLYDELMAIVPKTITEKDIKILFISGDYFDKELVGSHKYYATKFFANIASICNDNNIILSEYALNLNDILVTMDGTVGRTAKVFGEKQILAQRVGRLIANSEPEFLYQFLNTGKFFKKMMILSHGGSIKHISLTEISCYKNHMPSDNEEKERIGTFLQNLDNLITLNQSKLQKIKNIKKACLEKMFVQFFQTPKIKIINKKARLIAPDNCSSTLAVIKWDDEDMIKHIFENQKPKEYFGELKFINPEVEGDKPLRVMLRDSIYSYDYFIQADKIAEAFGYDKEQRTIYMSDKKGQPIILNFNRISVIIAVRM
jgi:hypothetical protein